MMEHDFKAVLSSTDWPCDDWMHKHHKAIKFALRFTEQALNGEVSNMTDMPMRIWVGYMHETVKDEYSLRCAAEKVGIDDEEYIHKEQLIAWLEGEKRYNEVLSCAVDHTDWNAAIEEVIEKVKGDG